MANYSLDYLKDKFDMTVAIDTQTPLDMVLRRFKREQRRLEQSHEEELEQRLNGDYEAVKYRKRYKIAAIYKQLKFDPKTATDNEFDVVARFEAMLGVDDDPVIEKYLEQSQSRIIYHTDLNRYTSREVMSSFLDKYFYYGNDPVHPVCVYDVCGVKLFKFMYEDYIQLKGFKPRQTMLKVEREAYLKANGVTKANIRDVSDYYYTVDNYRVTKPMTCYTSLTPRVKTDLALNK